MLVDLLSCPSLCDLVASKPSGFIQVSKSHYFRFLSCILQCIRPIC